jgi:hypothetical protein
LRHPRGTLPKKNGSKYQKKTKEYNVPSHRDYSIETKIDRSRKQVAESTITLKLTFIINAK